MVKHGFPPNKLFRKSDITKRTYLVKIYENDAW